MNLPILLGMGAMFLAAMSYVISAGAQQKAPGAAQQNRAYETSREVSLQGTVVSFTENSAAAPSGARVSIQTPEGTVDVHLGNGKLLQASHFTLAAGDTVRIIGENLAYGDGTQFFARILIKGQQTLAVRSVRGFPLRPTAQNVKTHAGAL